MRIWFRVERELGLNLVELLSLGAARKRDRYTNSVIFDCKSLLLFILTSAEFCDLTPFWSAIFHQRVLVSCYSQRSSSDLNFTAFRKHIRCKVHFAAGDGL